MTLTQTPIPTRRAAKIGPKPLRVIVITGTPGSGKSTVALNIAARLGRKHRVLLIDADTGNPSQTAALALSEHPAGLAPILRFARLSRLGPQEFEQQSMKLKAKDSTFTLIPGINPERWPEVTPTAFAEVVKVVSEWFDFIVIDTSSNLETGLSSGTSPLERHAFNRWLVQHAELLIQLTCPDQVSISRFISSSSTIQDLRAGKPTLTVVNKMRTAALGPSAKTQIQHTLKTLTGEKVFAYLPFDPKATDKSLRNGSPLNAVRRKSALEKAINSFTDNKLLAWQQFPNSSKSKVSRQPQTSNG